METNRRCGSDKTETEVRMKTKEKPIVGFFDTTCPKCQKRFGWHGKITDRPLCPRCGHNTTPEEAGDVENSIRQLDIFCVVQTVLFECGKRMSFTELEFINNMYEQHRNKRKYNQIQKKNIQRIATKYGILE